MIVAVVFIVIMLTLGVVILSGKGCKRKKTFNSTQIWKS